MKAYIVLENGTVLEGRGAGAKTTRLGEFVFNTAMTGYQEILTDPSYKGQFVVMTYPHIGNTGVNAFDAESGPDGGVAHLEGFVSREFSNLHSNYRADGSLSEWLIRRGLPAVDNVDTRKLTRIIREKGAMMGAISNDGTSLDELKEKVRTAPPIAGRDMILEVTCKKAWKWNPAHDEAPGLHASNRVFDGIAFTRKKKYGFRITVIDCGVKWNILRLLSLLGNEVTIVPANAPFEEIKATRPDGVMISNGPGDPAAVPYIVKTVRQVIEACYPIFGICFGHQLIGQALGGRTFKLKFGHHGANHPVKDLATGKVEITSQNHNYCLDVDTLDRSKVEVTHVHLNDETIEGLRYKDKPVFSVQYHPESSPGPSDSRYLFRRFMEMIEKSV
jgi:carbamoyl-phosphate synthase small subunit